MAIKSSAIAQVATTSARLLIACRLGAGDPGSLSVRDMFPLTYATISRPLARQQSILEYLAPLELPCHALFE